MSQSLFRILYHTLQILNNEQNDKECDSTDDDSSNAAGLIQDTSYRRYDKTSIVLCDKTSKDLRLQTVLKI